MRGTGVSFNTSRSRDKNSVEGFNQSISTPSAQIRFKRIDEDNMLLGQNILKMKPTISFKKNAQEHD